MDNSPEMRFKAGAISATVWKNSQTAGEKSFDFYTVGIGRNYKDKTGEWKSTSTLRMNDLPKAALVLGKAYEYLAMQAESV